MAVKIKFITMFSGYDPKTRFCEQKDKVSRTIQDAVVDVLGLFEQFAGKLPELFNKYNNGLLYESEIGVFVDELNADELAQYNKFVEDKAKREADQAEQDRLFEEWKSQKAAEVAAARANPPVQSEPKSE